MTARHITLAADATVSLELGTVYTDGEESATVTLDGSGRMAPARATLSYR